MKQLNTMRRLLTGVLAMVFVLGSAGIANAQYSGTGTFNKISSIEDLTDGYYVVTQVSNTPAMSNSHNGTLLAPVTATIASNQIINPAVTIVWKIETNETGRTIYSENSEKYVSYTGSSNNIQVVDALVGDNQRWNITYVSNKFVFANVAIPTRILQYNFFIPMFVTYTTNQQKFDLYKLEVAEGASLSPSTGALDAFSYTENEGPSDSKSFTLTGSDLSPADATITITAPSNFEVSMDDEAFSGHVTVDAIAGELASTTIHLRLSAGLGINTYNGTVSITGGDASTQVTVSGEVLPDHDFFETFETPNFNLTASYINGSFVGVTGVTWTYVQSRDQNVTPINGNNAIMLRRVADNSSLTSSTISGGINEFSVLLRKGFTGPNDRQVELLIGPDVDNLQSFGTSVAYDVNDEIRRFTVSDINYVGDFVLRITNTQSGQIVIDDVSWASYESGDVSLTGSAGYRLLSSPVEVSLQNFLAPVWTQGATAGADTDAGNPNVFTWNNSATNDDAANWSGVTDLTANLSAGNGVLVYVFQDDVYETPGSFPKTLSVSGTVNTLPVTPTMNSNSGGLTLVGNPIASIISWTALSRTDLSNTVYAWDPNTTLGHGGTDANNPSAGSWKTYNTSIGDLTDGRIHPFQAFFVQTSGNSPVLSIAQGAESTGGSFYGKETAPYAVRLQLDGEAISASKWLSFTGDAEIGHDNSDALQFQPLSLEYSLLASKLTDGTLLDINNLPVDLQETVRFPLIVESTQSGTHTLRVTELNLPTGYEVSILDNVTSLEHPLTPDFELSFELGTVAKNVPTPQNVIASGNLVAKAVEGDDRFELIVSPGTTLSNGILSELPAELALGQNYPNPFNPTTRIAFELPSSQFVKLSVFNMLGQEVSTLLQSEMNAGSHFVNFDASQLSSGVYVYRLEAVGQVITRKMTLVK